MVLNMTMGTPRITQAVSRRRSLVTFPEHVTDKLIIEAAKKGLRLATYIRYLVTTHPERASGAVSR